MRVRKVGMAQVVLVPQANKMYLADLYGDFVKVDDNDDEYECDCYRTTFPLQFDDEKNATAFFSSKRENPRKKLYASVTYDMPKQCSRTPTTSG